MLSTKKTNRQHSSKQEAINLVTTEDLKRLNVQVPKSKFIKLKQKAVLQDMTLTDLVNNWIDEYLSK